MAQARPAYFKRRLNRAFSDTIGPFGLNLKTGSYAIEIAVLALVFVWLFVGKDEARMELQITLATLAALVVVFGLNFVWNWVAAPARLQHDADEQIDILQETLDKIRSKQNAVDHLSTLLSEGIHTIWNAPVNSDAQLTALNDHLQDWRNRVVAYLTENFHQADVDHFNRMGVIPIIRREGTFQGSGPTEGQHERLLMQYALQEQRLREIIRDHNVTHV